MVKKASAVEKPSTQTKPAPKAVKPLKNKKVSQAIKLIPPTKPVEKASKKYTPAPTPETIKLTPTKPTKKAKPVVFEKKDVEVIKLLPKATKKTTISSPALTELKSEEESVVIKLLPSKKSTKSITTPATTKQDTNKAKLTMSDDLHYEFSDHDEVSLVLTSQKNKMDDSNEETISLLGGVSDDNTTIKLIQGKNSKEIARGVGVSKLKSQKRDFLRKISLLRKNDKPVDELQAKIDMLDEQIESLQVTNNKIQKNHTPARQKVMDYELKKVKHMLQTNRNALSLLIPGTTVGDDEAKFRQNLAKAEEDRLYIKNFPHNEKQYVSLFDEQRSNKREAIMNSIFSKLNYTRSTFRMNAGQNYASKTIKKIETEDSVDTMPSLITPVPSGLVATVSTKVAKKDPKFPPKDSTPAQDKGKKVEATITTSKKGETTKKVKKATQPVELDTDVWGTKGWSDSE